MKRFPIGVAVDGSAASTAAVRWAAGEAARRGVGLKIVHVCEIDSGSQWVMPRLSDRLQESCQVTSEAIESARQAAPDIEVTDWRSAGSAAQLLLLASQQTDLLVIGRSGKKAPAVHWAGSVTGRLATQAQCPIVTVPAPTAENAASVLGRIVVGLTDRPADGRALDFAIAEAGRYSAELVGVRAWGGSRSPEAGQLNEQSEQLRQARQLLAAHLSTAAPAIRTSCVVQPGSPASVLTGLCRPADLLVLGRHRHSRLLPARTGEVIADGLRQAPCPVAIVPESEPTDAVTWRVRWLRPSGHSRLPMSQARGPHARC
jgi:nucleotide-binding universal stress UspA family protein